MALTVKIYSPAGSEYDITNRIQYSDNPTINLRFEQDTNTFVVDDLSLNLRNEGGYFTSLWPLPLDPTLRFDEAAGNGAWMIKVTRGGATRFEGDLNVSSVRFIQEDKLVETCWVGASKRAEIDASSVLRVSENPIEFTNVRNNRKLTFAKTIATLGLQVGDIIQTDKLTINGDIIKQELLITEVGVTGTLTAYQARVRQGCKRVYTEGICSNPWYKTTDSDTLTVAECVELLLDFLGVSAGNQVVSGTGTSLQVDQFVTKDKTVSQLLSELAIYSGCIWWRNPDGKWYFIDRNANKTATIKNLATGGLGSTTLLSSVPIQAAQEDWYDSVIVEGTPPAFAPNSEPRKYRHGSSHAKSYKIETDFTSSLATLQLIAEQVYSCICKQRKKAEIRVKDDGTNYFLFDRASFNSENWVVVEVRESLESTEIKEYIDLVVLSENGTTLAATGSTFDNNEDDWPPYPPTLNALSSGKLAKRQSWWSDFRAVWPASEVPLVIKKTFSRETVSGDETVYEQKYMLWAGRLTYDHFGDAEDCTGIDGFEIIIYKDGEDPENVTNDGHYARRHKSVRIPVSDGKATPAKSGYVYFYFYKPMLPSAPDFYVVARTFVHGKELSAFSDPLSTGDYGGTDADASLPVITGCTLASTEDDVPGTAGVECNLTATVIWTGTASHIRVKAVAPSHTYYHTFEADASGETFEFPRMFKRGKSIHVYVRAWDVGTKTNWYDAGTITSGGAAIPTPQVPVIASVDRAEQSATVNITLTGSGTDVTSIGKLVVYQAPAGTTGDPTSNTAWHKVSQMDIAEDVAAGIRQWEAQIAKPLRKKKSFIVKAISKYDTTVKSWSSIYNEASASNIFTGISVTVSKEVLDTRTKKYTLTFSSLVARMVKIKVCKSASSTTPDPTRLQPHIDTLDYALDPPGCNSTVFSTEVTHAEGANPAVWFQPVGDNGDKMPTATGIVNGWFCVDVGGATAERLAGPQDGSNSITTAIKDAGRKVTLNYPGGVPANYSTIKVFCIAGSSPPAWNRSSGEVGEWGSELVALGASYVKNIAKASNNLSVSFEVLQYYSGGSYHAFTAANDLACCFLVCLVDNSSPAVDGYWGFGLRTGSTASFGTPEIVSITRGTGTATLVINYPSTGTPTSLGVVVRTLNPYAGATPANSPTTWASFSPQTYFGKATITGQAESGRKALTGSPMTIVVTGIVDTAAAFAVCVGIDGTGYGAWGLGYDAGSGGGGGGTPPTPVMENIGSSSVLLQFTWSDGNQYQVQVYYGTAESASTFLINSGGLVASGWTKSVMSLRYYKARLERISDGVVGEFCAAVRYV